jgi:hypothetical protein
LVALYPGRDPKLKAVLLLAHIDVVEAKRLGSQRRPCQNIVRMVSLAVRPAPGITWFSEAEV